MKKKEILIAIAIIILCAETIFLSITNLKLNNELKKYKMLFYRVDIQQSNNLEKNHLIKLSNLRLKELKDDSSNKYLFELLEGKNNLLFIFSTDCYLCDEMAPVWNEIFENFSHKYNIIGISIDTSKKEVEKYSARNNILFPIYQINDQEIDDILNSTPKTLLIDSNGVVLRIQSGYDENLKKFNLIKEG